MKGKKLERPLHLDMPADEALARFIQTKPEEVEPPPGRPRKAARSPAKARVPSSDLENEKGRDPKITP
jgi:hypothetical protein